MSLLLCAEWYKLSDVCLSPSFVLFYDENGYASFMVMKAQNLNPLLIRLLITRSCQPTSEATTIIICTSVHEVLI